MKKRMYRPLAALLSIAMLVGSVAVPVSAETSASETGFPEGLTYQQVCAMSEEEFMALPYAEKMVKEIHQYETSFFSYYLNFNRKPADLLDGEIIFQKGFVTRELKLEERGNGRPPRKIVCYHFPDEYTEAFTAYYGEEIAETALSDVEVQSLDPWSFDKLAWQEDTGITLTYPREEYFPELYTSTKFNDGLEEYDGLFRYLPSEYGTPEEIEQDPGLLVSFYLDGTLSAANRKDPVKEVQTIENWTEGQNAYRYIYDYDILWENSVETAKQFYGYFYVFGENVAILPPCMMLGGQPYEPICGDANADGMVTITDVIYLQKSIAGLLWSSNTTNTSGDLYYDGVVDERDVEILLRYLVGLEETLPVVPET